MVINERFFYVTSSSATIIVCCVALVRSVILLDKPKTIKIDMTIWKSPS